MSKVLVTRSLLEDIGDAIRVKTGESGDLTLPQMASAITGIKTSSALKYRFGQFYGSYDASAATSLSVTVNTPGNEKCIIIVAHRDSLTTPSGWELLYNTITPGATLNQWISIFVKDFNSSYNSSVSLVQASSVRICAVTMYFAQNVHIEEPVMQAFDSDATIYKHTIPASDDVYLCVANYAWSGNSSIDVMSIVASDYDTYMLPNNPDASVTRRLIVFVANSSSPMVFTMNNLSKNEDSNKSNRLYLYKLSTQ